MNHRSFILILLAAPLAALAKDGVTSQVQADMEKVTRDLADLREQVKAQKIPLATELSGLEDKLTKVRTDYELAARLLDTRNLDVTNLTNQMKLRQDEATYLQNIMDEYARGLESRVHVAELQALGPIINSAKEVLLNENLTPTQKFDRQLAVLKTSLDRIDDLVGGRQFEGEAVDGEGQVQIGKFAIIGPMAIFAAAGNIAGYAMPQSGGSNKPVIRALDEKLNAGIAQIASGGEGMLPFDPTRGSALQELMNRGSLWKFYKQGGPIMHPLALASIIGLCTVLERLLFMLREKMRTREKDREAIFDALRRGDLEQASTVSAKSNDAVARLLTYALTHREKSLTDALARAAGVEVARWSRGIVILETVITLAPLLGLLGTVTGMMASFGMLGGSELSSPAAITGGIAEALIATAFGLGIAITCVIPMNILVGKGEHARHEIEDACSHCELYAKPLLGADGKLDSNAANLRAAERELELADA